MQNCLSDLVQCTKDAISYIGELKSPTCAPGLETDAGLCYKPCKAGYTGVGPVCWSQTPQGWRDDGAFIHDSYARPQHWQVDLPTPPGATRTAACTMDFGHTVVSTPTVEILASPVHSTGRYEQGLRTRMAQDSGVYHPEGGIVTSCELYGQGCNPGEVKEGSMCYELPRPGYHCDLVNCYRDCPPGYKDIGISCQKDSYGRGVGEVPSQCRRDICGMAHSLVAPLISICADCRREGSYRR